VPQQSLAELKDFDKGYTELVTEGLKVVKEGLKDSKGQLSPSNSTKGLRKASKRHKKK
jgi:hypothetical protein